ncbi:MAG: NYN domain-containing protein [Pseudomonadota bacterium]
MASSPDNLSMAVFCDFENVALGVRDAKYDKFDIKPVLERLLLKGSIVVKKAYCDWDRYKGFKAAMHEANFELIEIPHVRQSGKNSADIRLVVDALDLCYTKSHVNTFVIISGDSDFSPLVSKLRENAKQVIGVGIKQSTSDLLVANCDEFIFYDDLVRESRRAAAGRGTRDAQPVTRRTPEEEQRRREEKESRRNQAIEIAVQTFDALVSERGDSGKIWSSLLKEAIKRRKPDFSESYYGFRAFGNLIEEAQARGLLEIGRDEKSNVYVTRGSGKVATSAAASASTSPSTAASRETAASEPAPAVAVAVTETATEDGSAKQERRRSRGGRKPAAKKAEANATQASRSEAAPAQAEAASPAPSPALPPIASPVASQPAEASEPAAEKKPARKTGTRTSKAAGSTKTAKSMPATPATTPATTERKPAERKPGARRPRKTEASE